MSEKLPKNPENSFESLAQTPAAERPKSTEYSAAEHEQAIEQAQAAVAAEASHSERPSAPQAPVDDRPQLIDHAIKHLRMRQNLKAVQSKLTPAERSFSTFVHQPLVQKVSESAAATVARPSGILGGGMCAFIGCLGYQLLVRHYGLPYNFSFFLVFFVAGFGFGLLGEYAWRHLKNYSLK